MLPRFCDSVCWFVYGEHITRGRAVEGKRRSRNRDDFDSTRKERREGDYKSRPVRSDAKAKRRYSTSAVQILLNGLPTEVF